LQRVTFVPLQPDYAFQQLMAGDAREGIGRYIGFYNTKRPHSSLDRQTPDQAYFNALQPIPVAA
jgi:hypothetical protein